MDGGRHDARTAARVRELRAACSLPIAGVHGSIEGRAGGPVLAVALEPGGRHAALLLRGAVERWDLDAIECVARWVAPFEDVPTAFHCAGEGPAGLRVVIDGHAWRGPTREGDAWQRGERFPRGAYPPQKDLQHVVTFPEEDGRRRAVRLDDGATLWKMWFETSAGYWRDSRGMIATAQGGWTVDPGGRVLLLQRSATCFDIAEAPPPPSRLRELLVRAVRSTLPGPSVVARLTTDVPVPEHRFRAALHAGRRLLALCVDTSILLGSWDDWPRARAIPLRGWFAGALAFTEDGLTLVLCADGRVVRVDVNSLSVRESSIMGADLNRVDRAVAMDPASGRVLYVAADSLFVVESDGAVRTLAADPVGHFTAVAGSLGGRTLVTAATDGSLRVRDRATGEVLARAETCVGVNCALAVSPDGREVIVAVPGVGVARYATGTGELVDRIDVPERYLSYSDFRLSMSPDGRRVWIAPEHEWDSSGYVVDLVTASARHVEDREEPAGRWSYDPGIAIVGDDLRRLRFSREDGGRGVVECVACPLEGGPATTLVRWPEPDVRQARHMLSRSGRLVWLETSVEEGLLQVCVSDVDASALAVASWVIDGPSGQACVGRSLLARMTSAPSLWLLSPDGRAARTRWAGGCELLAFAPDDRALWLRDESGLLVEVTVPDDLLDERR